MGSGIVGTFGTLMCVMGKGFGLVSQVNGAMEDGKVTLEEGLQIAERIATDLIPCFTGKEIAINLGPGGQEVATDVSLIGSLVSARIKEAVKDGKLTVDELAGILGVLFAAALPNMAVKV
uniref:Uncharacterized protein n=1 Tax=viral metagenome TaxID=1070528 RepID=A0A6M3LN70_9ZZZZ